MRLIFWGTRGGFVAPGEKFLRYGGATMCIEIVASSGARVVVDLGTGAIALGGRLMGDGSGTKKFIVLLSHTQFDHIMGLPFFAPALAPGFELTIMGPSHAGRSISAILDGALNPDYSPLYSIENLKVKLKTVAEGDLWWEGFRIRARELPHETSSSLGFRVEADGKVISVITDVAYAADIPPAIFDLASEADVLIHDSMGLAQEMSTRVAHPRPADAARAAKECGAKKLFLFHHDPDVTDIMMDAALERLRAQFPGLLVDGARQGTEVQV